MKIKVVKKCFSYAVLFVVVAMLNGCKKDVAIHPHIKIKVLAKNLENPWGMGFLPNGDFIFCQRSGTISLMKKGASDFNSIMSRIVQTSEGGLLGMAIDPDYANTHYVFIYETINDTINQIVRLIFDNPAIRQDAIILGNIPASYNHDGGALKFGPDGYLYVGTGDALKPNTAQDKNSIAGKILRIDKNGNAAPGNPFNNRVWTYGHRNVQGFDWNAEGKMISTEHGPTSEFGWCCHDEINLIEPGKNYGWPLAIGGTEKDTLTPPLYCTGFETIAPSGCVIIKGKQWGDWEGNLLVGALKAERLIRFKITDDGSAFVSRADTLINQYLRLRNVIQAPDGSIIFSSSNMNTPSFQALEGDDKLYQLYFE